MAQEIIAIRKQIEDERTGAMSDYHIATRYYVDEAANYAEVGFSTYVSEAAYKSGREPVSGSGVVLKMSDLPPRGGDIKDWFYQAAILEPAEGVENGSVLAGGELVSDIENAFASLEDKINALVTKDPKLNNPLRRDF